MSKKFMKMAIDEAIANIDKGGGPFGAVITREGKIIARCGNRVTADNDPTAHAEVLAIREAARVLGSWDLSECEIYSSCEPCPMCLGAIYWAHIPVLHFAGLKEDARNAGFDDSFIYEEIDRKPEDRKLKSYNILREEAVKGFEKWIAFENKEHY
ncbi:MAG: nucleoside deaminase [Bacteroidales bacterium]|nr:nucleoside deaminase [Bacteroidales bacterium]MCB8999826.1 nucleoside deaminase [Bacteroidales bacterium]